MKKIFAALLAVCLLFCLAGCKGDDGSLKENLLIGYDNLMQMFSKFALTPDISLTGNRTLATDEYTGTYSADYDRFNGKEFIFGGTALKRKGGDNLILTYSLSIVSGSAMLYWINANDEFVISEETAEDTYKILLNEGDNYIVLKGENFIGKLEIQIDNVSVDEIRI